MTNRIYWGLGVLILLIIGTTIFILMHNTGTITGPIVIYEVDNESSKDDPPSAESGYKWVWHDGHWDKMPISEKGDRSLNNQITPISGDSSAGQTSRKNKSLQTITYEEYEQQVTQAWANIPRDEWGNPLKGLPDTPAEAGKWQSLDELLKAGNLWHQFNAKEAKRLHAAHAAMKAYYDSKSKGVNIK